MRSFFLLGSLVLALLLSACSSSPEAPSRYSQKHDSIPTRLPTAAELVEPAPRFEARSRGGNKTYSLFGQTWHILDDISGYHEEGIASWYGEKFHGHLTSNGETYDMYAMSAAHKTLPLPTYVRVTNLDNNKTVVVRVNDRGPFHHNRIIDLSYVAAYKLGMLKSGTARVHIEALQPQADNQALAATAPLAATQQQQYYIQLHAGSDKTRLQQEAQRLEEIYQVPATTQPNKGLYRLVLGPFVEPQTTELLEQLRRSGYPGAFRVALP